MKITPTFLAVDDSKVARMMIHAVVKDQSPDWTVLEAGNGDEALSLAENSMVDFFSIDFNMPGMDGLELIEKLKVKYPAAKMVLMTANAQESILIKTGALGAIVIAKPVTEQSVKQMLDYFNE